MLFYIYDGSFDGLLTAIYEAYYQREVPDKILSREDCQIGFLIEKRYIETDMEKSSRVYNSIKTKISSEVLRNIFYAYLSEFEDVGTSIYHYLKLGWKIGKDVDMNLSDDRVLEIQKVRQKVLREVHLLLGLTRFRELKGGLYYAPIEPQYNVIGLLAPHFSRRLSDQNWMIHDVKRGIGVAYNQQEWIIRDMDLHGSLQFEKEEKDYQKLWQTYFKSIAIQNRINPKLQKRCMPMKYWRYLIEKNEE